MTLPMTETPELLAETPMFKTDAFSEVLDIVHVRGDSARMVTQDMTLDYAVPAGRPCVYIVQQGHLQITPAGGAPVQLEAQ